MIAGASAAAILFALGAIHLYWAAGGGWGKGGTIPERRGIPVFRPGALSTCMVALGLFSMAALLVARMGWIGSYKGLATVRIGVWLVAGVFVLRAVGDFRYVGFFKRERGGRFAKLDTLAYTPLCLILAILIVIAGSG